MKFLGMFLHWGPNKTCPAYFIVNICGIIPPSPQHTKFSKIYANIVKKSRFFLRLRNHQRAATETFSKNKFSITNKNQASHSTEILSKVSLYGKNPKICYVKKGFICGKIKEKIALKPGQNASGVINSTKFMGSCFCDSP